MVQNMYIYVWIPAKSASCDMSSTPRSDPNKWHGKGTTGDRKDIFNSHNWTRAKRYSPRISRFTGIWELSTYDTFYFNTRNIGNTDNDDNEVYVRRTR